MSAIGDNNIIAPFATPFYMMAKPVGSTCNLACEYCYYLEKKKYFPGNERHTMSDETLELFIRQYIESSTSQSVLFTWHGGEALLRPIEFYNKVISLQKRYAGGRIIDNSIQTNGILLNDAWCRFFKENNWLVGISIDGPQTFHDEYRRDHSGRPSFMKVLKSIRLLQNYGIEWNAMAVVNDYNADYPIEFYNFFRDNGCQYVQFTPIVERIGYNGLASVSEKGDIAPFSVSPEQWGSFLCAVFDEWVKKDVGTIFVQIFDSTLANWMGMLPGVCVYAATCGHAGVVEYNGDVYSCDHFVFPEYRLGNIHKSTLHEMMSGSRQITFGNDKRTMLPRQCKECKFLFACNGECPKNRISVDKYGLPGLNYLCKGYFRFFEHVAPYMEYMKTELINRRPPANIMDHLSEICAH